MRGYRVGIAWDTKIFMYNHRYEVQQMIEKYMVRVSPVGAVVCCLFFIVAIIMFTGGLFSCVLLLAELYVCLCSFYWMDARSSQGNKLGILEDMWLS